MKPHTYRLYNSDMGRFTQKDPIGFAGGDESLYRYVGNRPVYFKDGNGMREISSDVGRVFSLDFEIQKYNDYQNSPEGKRKAEEIEQIEAPMIASMGFLIGGSMIGGALLEPVVTSALNSAATSCAFNPELCSAGFSFGSGFAQGVFEADLPIERTPNSYEFLSEKLGQILGEKVRNSCGK